MPAVLDTLVVAEVVVAFFMESTPYQMDKHCLLLLVLAELPVAVK